MTREQLLKGLYYVQEHVDAIIKTYEMERRIEVQFLDEKEKIDTQSVAGKAKAGTKIVFLTGSILYFFLALLFWNTDEQMTAIMMIAGAAILFWKRKEKRSKLRILAIICIAIAAVSFMYDRFVYGGAFFLICLFVFLGVLVTGVYVFYVKRKNQSIESENEEIREKNAQLYHKYDVIVANRKKLMAEMYQNTRDWYPQSYYAKTAVDWFIQAVSNHRCDSVKEMVNLYEESMDRQNMIREQQATRMEMRQGFGELARNQQAMQRKFDNMNMLQMMNIASSMQTRRAIEQGTAAMKTGMNRLNETIKNKNLTVHNHTDVHIH